MSWKVFGSRAKRLEDPALLRGKARFIDDIRLAGTLHAFFAPDLERELIGKHIFGVPADKQPRWG